MTQTVPISCPHCNAANSMGAQFCESCGMALPSQQRSTPRVVDASGFAQTSVGLQLQSDSLLKEAGGAAKALMWVAIIQSIVLAVVLGVLSQRFGGSEMVKNPIVIAQLASAMIFWGLFLWARAQPLPAAIVGLALYLTLVAINMITAISHLGDQNAHAGGFGGLGIGWLDIVIMAILFRAISSGLKYRKLMATGPIATAN